MEEQCAMGWLHLILTIFGGTVLRPLTKRSFWYKKRATFLSGATFFALFLSLHNGLSKGAEINTYEKQIQGLSHLMANSACILASVQAEIAKAFATNFQKLRDK